MQNYVYPSSSDVTLTGTPNNAPIPTTSLLVAGENPSGNQEPLQTDSAGNLNVNVISSSLPAGAATSANQALEITQLTGIHSDTTSLDGKTVHVDTGNVTVASSALPAGAATSALQTTGNSTLSTIAVEAVSIDSKTPVLGQALAAASVPVVLTAAQITTLTPPTSITVSASALPTGASTSALQTTISGQLPTTLGQKVEAASLAVVLASDQSALPVAGATGRSVANAPVYNVYSATNITTAAYVQLIASTTNATNFVDIFDSSGNAMILAVGASGSEVIQAYVAPGGDQIPLAIPAGSRVSYKALTADSTSGYLLINLLK